MGEREKRIDDLLRRKRLSICLLENGKWARRIVVKHGFKEKYSTLIHYSSNLHCMHFRWTCLTFTMYVIVHWMRIDSKSHLSNFIRRLLSTL